MRRRGSVNVRFVPKATEVLRNEAAPLFDHFVGAGKERFRDSEPDRLGGLEIDYQFEMGWLLDWDIVGFGSAQHLDEQARPLTIDFLETRAISHEAALFRHVGPLIYGGQAGRRGTLE